MGEGHVAGDNIVWLVAKASLLLSVTTAARCIFCGRARGQCVNCGVFLVGVVLLGSAVASHVVPRALTAWGLPASARAVTGEFLCSPVIPDRICFRAEQPSP